MVRLLSQPIAITLTIGLSSQAAPAEKQENLSDQLTTASAIGALDADVLQVDVDDQKAGVFAFNPKTDTARFGGSGEVGSKPPTTWDDFPKDNLLKKSNEALGIWFDKDGKVWKIYGNTNQKDKVTKALADVAKAGLPVANATIKSGQVSVIQKAPYAPWKIAFSVVTDRLQSPWKWFSGQDSAGISNFRTDIQSISDKVTLTSIKDALVKAVAYKLTDPQGFINKGMKANNIQFIDIHKGTTATVAEEMLEIVNEQLKKL